MKRCMIHGFLFLLLALGAATTFSSESDNTVKMEKKDIPAGEEVAVLQTTKGDIVLRFFPDVAPKHVENFKKLVKSKFYDGTKFHRTIPKFMIQGGCPKTKEEGQERLWGTGNPGWTVKAEFNKKPHVKGTLSMARSSHPDSAGSQFFICHARASFLDGKYTVFGETVSGLDVVDKIVTAPTIQDGRENSRPKNPVEIKKAYLTSWEQYLKDAEKRKLER